MGSERIWSAPWTQTLLGAGLAVTLIVASLTNHATSNATSDVAANPSTAGATMVIDGSTVDRVKLNGRVVSFQEYQTVLLPQVEHQGGALHLMVDPSAVTRGYMVAFDSLAQANEYTAARNARNAGWIKSIRKADPRSIESALVEASGRKTSKALTLGRDKVELATCSSQVNYAKLYDGTSCTGTQYIALWGHGHDDPNLGVVGFGDKMSSLAMGLCSSNLYAFKDTYWSGSSTSYGGPYSVYTSANIGFNNNVSSIQADSNGLCPPV